MNPIRIAGSAFPPLNRPAKPARSGLPPPPGRPGGRLLQRHAGLLGERAGLLDAAAGEQPARRLGHLEERQRQQRDDRQGTDPEHAPPADPGEQDDGEQRGQQAPEGHAAVDDGVAEVLLPGRGELRDDRARGGHQGADAEAGDEPHQPEAGRGGHQRGDGHADREPRVGQEHDLAPADDVGDGAGEQRSDQHADQRVAAQRAAHGGGDRPDLGGVAQERRQDRSVDDEVVAVEDETDEGEADDPHDRACAAGPPARLSS